MEENLENIEFTEHVLERYVERTMDKSGNEIKQFLAQNEEQVKQQILKLYQYSEPFWYGKNKEHNYTYFRINKNGWLIVIDKNKTKLITLYKIDLGLGEEFNKQYISQMIQFVENANQEIENEKEDYNNKVIGNNMTIEELKQQNKLLQAQIQNNQDTIKMLEEDKNINLDKISIQEQKLKAKIEKFIGAKIF